MPEGVLVELVGGDQPNRQVEALVGDGGEHVFDATFELVRGRRYDEHLDPLGQDGVAHLLHRPEPAQTPILAGSPGADPAGDVVGLDSGRLELSDEVGRELTGADDCNSSLEPVLRYPRIQAPRAITSQAAATAASRLASEYDWPAATATSQPAPTPTSGVAKPRMTRLAGIRWRGNCERWIVEVAIKTDANRIRA